MSSSPTSAFSARLIIASDILVKFLSRSAKARIRLIPETGGTLVVTFLFMCITIKIRHRQKTGGIGILVKSHVVECQLLAHRPVNNFVITCRGGVQVKFCYFDCAVTQ